MLKLNKFFSTIVFLNFFALLLVYQQTEIIKFGYKNKRQKDKLQELDDYHNHLKYRIETHKSLDNINNRLFTQAENFQLPEESQIMTLRTARDTRVQETIVKTSLTRRNIFSKIFFWLEHEAQAEANE